MCGLAFNATLDATRKTWFNLLIGAAMPLTLKHGEQKEKRGTTKKRHAPSTSLARLVLRGRPLSLLVAGLVA